MIPDDDQIRALVARPGESLNVEIKRWLNPSDPTSVAKIIKATFALRNRNGGFLVIGFDSSGLTTRRFRPTPRTSRPMWHVSPGRRSRTRFALPARIFFTLPKLRRCQP
jgi:hypothetical protein